MMKHTEAWIFKGTEQVPERIIIKHHHQQQQMANNQQQKNQHIEVVACTRQKLKKGLVLEIILLLS